jgi:hypothetical protein
LRGENVWGLLVMGATSTRTTQRILRRLRTPALAGAILAIACVGSALASGNRAQIKVPKRAEAGVSYAVTIHGHTAALARLYLFIDYHKCGANPAVEHQRANGVYWTVQGKFSKTSRGWRTPTKGPDHACVYLVNPSAAIDSPLGVLMRARAKYRIH